MQLTIIIPAYNEEARLARMLDAYLPYFSARYGDNVEVLIVVNGSRDHTAAIAGEWATRYRQVRW